MDRTKIAKVNMVITTVYMIAQLVLLWLKLVGIMASWFLALLPTVILFVPIVLVLIWIAIVVLLNWFAREVTQ